jgi:excisionase family DNA binding protein
MVGMVSTAEHKEHADDGRVEQDRRQLLPVSDVAARTGLSRWTIYRRIRSGEWPSGRSGRKHLIPAAFVDGLVAEIEKGRQVAVENYAATAWLANASEGAA